MESIPQTNNLAGVAELKLCPATANAEVVRPKPYLDRLQIRKLQQCEAIVCRAIADDFAAGRALITIRDERLYRRTHRTFEEYCRSRWLFSRTHVNRLINMAKILDLLAPIGAIVENAYQVRPLSGLSAEAVPKAWQMAEVLADGGKVTERHVRQAAIKFRGKSEPAPEVKPSVLNLIDLIVDSIQNKKSDEALRQIQELRNLLARRGKAAQASSAAPELHPELEAELIASKPANSPPYKHHGSSRLIA